MFNRPAQGFFGGGVSTGEGLSLRLDMNESKIEHFFKGIEDLSTKLATAPAVIAGGKYGTPLINLLRQTTPYNYGERRYGGAHLKNSWRQTTFESSHGTEVQIFNVSPRANVLAFLELGTRRHPIAAVNAKRLYFIAKQDGSKGGKKGELVGPMHVMHPKVPGRFFLRAVQNEANKRLRAYIDNMVNSLKKGSVV